MFVRQVFQTSNHLSRRGGSEYRIARDEDIGPATYELGGIVQIYATIDFNFRSGMLLLDECFKLSDF